MQRLTAFPPIARADARVLILGSMPGAASLAAGQYYAHPRNAFWPIMGALLGFDPAAPYPERVSVLMDHHIAVWDVLAACVRPGSLDADIAKGSEEVNDFRCFLAGHPDIRLVCFNGTSAESYFRKKVLESSELLELFYVRLPSTSPAHASMGFRDKLSHWKTILAT